MIIFDYDFIVLVSLYELNAVIFCCIHQRQLIGRWAAQLCELTALRSFFLTFASVQNRVTQSKVVEKSL